MRWRRMPVSGLLPVPPRRIKSLANQSMRGRRAARPPSPLPGHPLPTTGLGGREVAVAGGGEWEQLRARRGRGGSRRLRGGGGGGGGVWAWVWVCVRQKMKKSIFLVG